MLLYGWLVLGLRFWLYIFCFYPVGSLILRVEGESANVSRVTLSIHPFKFRKQQQQQQQQTEVALNLLLESSSDSNEAKLWKSDPTSFCCN